MKLLLMIVAAAALVGCSERYEPAKPEPLVVLNNQQNDVLTCRYGYFSEDPALDGKLLEKQETDIKITDYSDATPKQGILFEDTLSRVTISYTTDQSGTVDRSSNLGKSVTFEIQHKNKANPNSKYAESVMVAKTHMGWNMFNIYIGEQYINGVNVSRAHVACGFFNQGVEVK